MSRHGIPRGAEVVTSEIDRPQRPWIDGLISADHKIVGGIQIALSLSCIVFALTCLLLTQLQLALPNNTLLDATTFAQMLTTGQSLGFFFGLVPLALGLATYLLPLQTGTRGLALPRLAQISLWLFIAGAAVLLGMVIFDHPPSAGFAGLTPLSSAEFTPRGVNSWILALALAGGGTLTGAINLVVTTSRMRGPGMAWRRMPLFSLAASIGAWIQVIATPVLLAALTMLLMDREYKGMFFVANEGGSPLAWQVMFWFATGGLIVAVLLSALGAASEIFSTSARRPILGHAGIGGAFGLIGVLGLLSWLTNLQTSPIPLGWKIGAMVISALMIAPFALVAFNWIGTLWGGSVSVRAPLRLTLAGVSLLSFGLGLKLMLVSIPVAWGLSRSAFGSAAALYLVAGMLTILLGAVQYWFPKITGRLMGDGLSSFGAASMLGGAHLMLIPMAILGIAGEPQNVAEWMSGTGWGVLHILQLFGFLGYAAGAVTVLANAAFSYGSGALAGHDPWLGTTLEWFTTSPPPPNNFDAIPDVLSAQPMLDLRHAIADRERRQSKERSRRATEATRENDATPAASSTAEPG